MNFHTCSNCGGMVDTGCENCIRQRALREVRKFLLEKIDSGESLYPGDAFMPKAFAATLLLAEIEGGRFEVRDE
ncbi:MAG: hypothetical protein OEM32_04570 [Acidimicrobiia bacterium]|nr:hypothetical protein [Acidimicrobiia bacterium]